VSVLIVVPSRLGSTRFSKKVLAPLDGKPIVRWCWEAATAAKVGDVLIATEAQEVADAVTAFGGKAVMTSASCQSGTDRCFEAAKGRRDDFIINVQGDQPFIKPETIRAVVKLLQEDRMVDIATAVMKLEDAQRASDPNVVKVAMNAQKRCLYFSRSLIPFPRNPATARYWEHLGIYGFKRAALERFVSLPPSPLEVTESLEQLRALEAGMTIAAAVVEDFPVAIDTPEDLSRAETFLRRVK
jgi:3-deoxy-manno-octulosonate cytidylyltransferase (CMP-KDO synthetase)